MGLREIFIPQDKQYFDFFTLQAKNIQLASQKLLAAFSTEELSIEQAREEIRQIKHENDQIVYSIYDRLNTSFITPIDSNDILALSSGYDTIIDYIYTTINRFFLYRIVASDASMKRFAEIVNQCAVEAVVFLGSSLGGIPVSTTHVVAGSIMGVGATKRFSAVRWGIARRIVWAWIITIPMSATVAALAFVITKFLIG